MDQYAKGTPSMSKLGESALETKAVEGDSLLSKKKAIQDRRVMVGAA
jgi:hypothetical protein